MRGVQQHREAAKQRAAKKDARQRAGGMAKIRAQRARDKMRQRKRRASLSLRCRHA